MSYQVWSVVYGEQPSASKWNILGNNDIAFNDGTGIIDDAILQRHIADAQIATAQLDTSMQDFKELGRQTLSGVGTTLEVTFTAKKYLMVILGLVANVSGLDCFMQFNNDTGANYAERYSSNHGADVQSPSTDRINVEVGNVLADGCEFAVINIYNPSGADKNVFLYSVFQTALTAATIPTWSDMQSIWNSNTQVSTITITADQQMKAGAELIVLGHD